MAYNKIKSTINSLDTNPAEVLAKNLSNIRKTNGRIGQTMKIGNARVNTKVLVATRAKRG
jgi:hypothetical protein